MRWKRNLKAFPAAGGWIVMRDKSEDIKLIRGILEEKKSIHVVARAAASVLECNVTDAKKMIVELGVIDLARASRSLATAYYCKELGYTLEEANDLFKRVCNDTQWAWESRTQQDVYLEP